MLLLTLLLESASVHCLNPWGRQPREGAHSFVNISAKVDLILCRIEVCSCFSRRAVENNEMKGKKQGVRQKTRDVGAPCDLSELGNLHAEAGSL